MVWSKEGSRLYACAAAAADVGESKGWEGLEAHAEDGLGLEEGKEG